MVESHEITLLKLLKEKIEDVFPVSRLET